LRSRAAAGGGRAARFPLRSRFAPAACSRVHLDERGAAPR